MKKNTASTIKAVIFDLDGTLLDSAPDIAASLNYALSSADLPTHSLDQVKLFIGSGSKTLVTRAIPQKMRSEGLSEQIHDVYTNHYALHGFDHSHLFAGIAELLNALMADNIRLALLSNKPAKATIACATRFLATWSFEPVVGAGGLISHKPDPSGVNHILAQWRCSPNEVLFVGDMEPDMLTAKGAGIRGVGALWGYRSQEILMGAGADFCIEKPMDLINVFSPDI